MFVLFVCFQDLQDEINKIIGDCQGIERQADEDCNSATTENLQKLYADCIREVAPHNLGKAQGQSLFVVIIHRH